MDVFLQAADALAASSFIAPKKECVILKIQRRLDDLNSKMELILSLLKDKTEKTEKTEKQKKKVKISETETKARAVIKLASKEILKLSTSSARTSFARTAKNSSSPSSSPTSSPSSLVVKRVQSMQSMKTKDYYDKYPEIKKKFWGVGPGRRSSSTLKKMDQLIAQLK